ncbi:GDSL-type esterase/lipase family protein [Arthrobacter parietis]|uniref:GDSL-type esterase/lipase family protein n=1 Tax=Arthrobacter parietis TaxID=271434 RepID=UPI0031F92834
MTGLLGPAVATAVPTVQLSDDPVALGKALAGDITWVTGAAFETRAGASASALVSDGVAGLPTSGPMAAMLSTGNAMIVTDPNTSGSSGADLGGSPYRGNSDFDVTVLRVDLEVPSTVNCLVGIDFRFLSEEYPEYVGSRYNDAFIAELDESTWTTSGSEIIAPDNFAHDPSGSPITVNSAGATSMSQLEAAGTTFDGATPLLTAATPLTPGPHSLYLSIFDQGDRAYDSGVIVDNLRMGTVGNVATDCVPGAEVADNSRYVGLGDSYSSGFGVAPYFPGTFEDSGPNNCQRSDRAYAPLVAAARGLTLDFHACQGAVTKDFYGARNDTWGESPQLDHLNEETGLVTLSIGGNDAKFGDVLAECLLGMELLPFNTCYKDDKVLTPVREAMERLDGQTDSPSDITPYVTLYRDIRRAAPTATVAAVGYPHFYPASGGDRTFLPGGRCEGIKKVDQRWMVEKIDELNSIIETNARRSGFLFANPNPSFDGHELCSGGEEWIYPLLSAGRIHPTVEGQQAISEAVLTELDDSGFETFEVLPQQTVTYSFVVDSPKEFISLVTGWPGSDVSLTLISPSGQRFDRSTDPAGATRETGPTHEHVEVSAPETGEWTVELFGLDVPDGGEPVTLSIHQQEPKNAAPTGVITPRVEGNSLVLDASGSSDSDGTITGFDWYISTAETDEVLQGEKITIPLNTDEERTVSLVITDDRGATDFQDLAWIPVDVVPGSSTNPINLRSKGVTPIALVSSVTYDAMTVAPTTLLVGPGEAKVRETQARGEDVNGDGLLDQIVHVRTQDLGLSTDSTQLCLGGTLNNGRAVSSCDSIRVK